MYVCLCRVIGRPGSQRDDGQKETDRERRQDLILTHKQTTRDEDASGNLMLLFLLLISSPSLLNVAPFVTKSLLRYMLDTFLYLFFFLFFFHPLIADLEIRKEQSVPQERGLELCRSVQMRGT